MIKHKTSKLYKTVPFKIPPNMIKYPGINLANKVLYKKNYKIEDANGKTLCIHGLKDLLPLKCSCYPKPAIDSMQSLSES